MGLGCREVCWGEGWSTGGGEGDGGWFGEWFGGEMWLLGTLAVEIVGRWL